MTGERKGKRGSEGTNDWLDKRREDRRGRGREEDHCMLGCGCRRRSRLG